MSPMTGFDKGFAEATATCQAKLAALRAELEAVKKERNAEVARKEEERTLLAAQLDRANARVAEIEAERNELAAFKFSTRDLRQRLEFIAQGGNTATSVDALCGTYEKMAREICNDLDTALDNPTGQEFLAKHSALEEVAEKARKHELLVVSERCDRALGRLKLPTDEEFATVTDPTDQNNPVMKKLAEVGRRLNELVEAEGALIKALSDYDPAFKDEFYKVTVKGKAETMRAEEPK